MFLSVPNTSLAALRAALASSATLRAAHRRGTLTGPPDQSLNASTIKSGLAVVPVADVRQQGIKRADGLPAKTLEPCRSSLRCERAPATATTTSTNGPAQPPKILPFGPLVPPHRKFRRSPVDRILFQPGYAKISCRSEISAAIAKHSTVNACVTTDHATRGRPRCPWSHP